MIAARHARDGSMATVAGDGDAAPPLPRAYACHIRGYQENNIFHFMSLSAVALMGLDAGLPLALQNCQLVGGVSNSSAKARSFSL